MRMTTHKVTVVLDDETSYVVETSKNFVVRELLSKICTLQNGLHPTGFLTAEDLCFTSNNGQDRTIYMSDACIDLDMEQHTAFRVIGVSRQQQLFTQKLKDYRRLIDIFTSELEKYTSDQHCHIADLAAYPIASGIGAIYTDLEKRFTSFSAHVRDSLERLLPIASTQGEQLHLHMAADYNLSGDVTSTLRHIREAATAHKHPTMSSTIPNVSNGDASALPSSGLSPASQAGSMDTFEQTAGTDSPRDGTPVPSSTDSPLPADHVVTPSRFMATAFSPSVVTASSLTRLLSTAVGAGGKGYHMTEAVTETEPLAVNRKHGCCTEKPVNQEVVLAVSSGADVTMVKEVSEKVENDEVTDSQIIVGDDVLDKSRNRQPEASSTNGDMKVTVGDRIDSDGSSSASEATSDSGSDSDTDSDSSGESSSSSSSSESEGEGKEDTPREGRYSAHEMQSSQGVLQVIGKSIDPQDGGEKGSSKGETIPRTATVVSKDRVIKASALGNAAKESHLPQTASVEAGKKDDGNESASSGSGKSDGGSSSSSGSSSGSGDSDSSGSSSSSSSDSDSDNEPASVPSPALPLATPIPVPPAAPPAVTTPALKRRRNDALPKRPPALAAVAEEGSSASSDSEIETGPSTEDALMSLLLNPISKAPRTSFGGGRSSIASARIPSPFRSHTDTSKLLASSSSESDSSDDNSSDDSDGSSGSSGSDLNHTRRRKVTQQKVTAGDEAAVVSGNDSINDERQIDDTGGHITEHEARSRDVISTEVSSKVTTVPFDPQVQPVQTKDTTLMSPTDVTEQQMTRENAEAVGAAAGAAQVPKGRKRRAVNVVPTPQSPATVKEVISVTEPKATEPAKSLEDCPASPSGVEMAAAASKEPVDLSTLPKTAKLNVTKRKPSSRNVAVCTDSSASAEVGVKKDNGSSEMTKGVAPVGRASKKSTPAGDKRKAQSQAVKSNAQGRTKTPVTKKRTAVGGQPTPPAASPGPENQAVSDEDPRWKQLVASLPKPVKSTAAKNKAISNGTPAKAAESPHNTPETHPSHSTIHAENSTKAVRAKRIEKAGVIRNDPSPAKTRRKKQRVEETTE